MKHELAVFSLTFLAALSGGCSSDSGDDTGAGTGGAATGGTGGATGGTAGSAASGTGGAPACNGMVTAAPANNYHFSSTLSFPPIAVQPDAELTFDWSAVTTDFLGHPLDPMTGVDTVNLMLWKLTQEDLQIKLNADTLKQRDLAVIATLYTEKMATNGALFDFTSVGMVLTPCDILPFLQAGPPPAGSHSECPGWEESAGTGYDPATHTYTVMIAAGTELGAGTRMIQAFKLDPASTNTHVEVTPTSTHLEYSVDMQSLVKTEVPSGTGALSIEWGGMTVNALQNEFIPNNITRALVAHYSQPVSELEAQFLDLELISQGMWRGNIDSGTSANLSTFTNEAGEPFPGIDGTGTWVLALICGGCRNPAPWYMTVLTPCGQ